VQIVFASGSARGTVLGDGAEELVSSGGVAVATTISSGGRAVLSSGGDAVDATVSSGGILYVLASGRTDETVVSSGGEEVVSSGGGALRLSLASGGVVVDDGEVRIGGAGTLDGTLTGSGAIVQDGTGDLVLGDSGAGFSGKAAIESGTVELASAGALGTGYVQFVEPATGSAVLQIDAADAPAAGGTFANVISNFSGAHEDIDLRSIAFVAGASATISGSTLVLSDGGKTYKFKLEGGVAGAYPILSDGHGGTLIDPQVARFAHTAAAFAPSDAATAALVSSTSPIARTPFLHAAASAGHS
jgi:autotransporter passenger strand-loop-strand repeat protein